MPDSVFLSPSNTKVEPAWKATPPGVSGCSLTPEDSISISQLWFSISVADCQGVAVRGESEDRLQLVRVADAGRGNVGGEEAIEKERQELHLVKSLMHYAQVGR